MLKLGECHASQRFCNNCRLRFLWLPRCGFALPSSAAAAGCIFKKIGAFPLVWRLTPNPHQPVEMITIVYVEEIVWGDGALATEDREKRDKLGGCKSSDVAGLDTHPRRRVRMVSC